MARMPSSLGVVEAPLAAVVTETAETRSPVGMDQATFSEGRVWRPDLEMLFLTTPTSEAVILV